MLKLFSSFKSSHIFLGVTTVIATLGSFSDPLLAQANLDIWSEDLCLDITAETETPKLPSVTSIEFGTNSPDGVVEKVLNPENQTYFLLTQEVDWDAFCEKFPENSMCEVQREQEQESSPQPTEPPSAESEPPTAPEPPEPPEPEASEAEQPPPSESDSQSDSSESDSNNQQPERKWGPLNENSGVAFEPQVSSLGVGMDITARVSENVNARAGFGVWSLTEDYQRTDVKYNADVKLRSGAAVMDIYPIEGTEIRLSGGVMLNGNQVDTIGQSETVVVAGVQQQVYTIGGRTFTAQEVGTLSGEITFPLVAPFVGVGWGNAVKPGRRLGFTVDLGVMIHGTPQVSLRATNQAVTPQLQESIDKEIEDLQAEFDGFKFYPVLQVGISYQF